MAAGPVLPRRRTSRQLNHLRSWQLRTWVRYYHDDEPVASAVQTLLQPSTPIPPIINAVTLGEIYNAIAREKGSGAADWFVASLRRSTRIESVEADHAIQTGTLKTRYHMSLGDSYIAASALRNGAILWTGDAELLFEDCPWEVNDLRDDNI